MEKISEKEFKKGIIRWIIFSVVGWIIQAFAIIKYIPFESYNTLGIFAFKIRLYIILPPVLFGASVIFRIASWGDILSNLSSFIQGQKKWFRWGCFNM